MTSGNIMGQYGRILDYLHNRLLPMLTLLSIFPCLAAIMGFFVWSFSHNYLLTYLVVILIAAFSDWGWGCYSRCMDRTIFWDFVYCTLKIIIIILILATFWLIYKSTFGASTLVLTIAFSVPAFAYIRHAIGFCWDVYKDNADC